ncbi:MAG: site-specific integrase [Desulfamplus sp.]|nr:site-specific integrase [Desulfamplus sp.]
MNPHAINCLFKRWSQKINLHIHPHLLRHTYAMTVVNNGISQKALQQQL